LEYITGFIYLIRNKINGMEYVGQTIQNLQKRLQMHQYIKSHCSYLRNAMNKYGFENFEMICLEKILEPTRDSLSDKLNILEKEYILRKNTLFPKGYNLTTGGSQPIISSDSVEKRAKKHRKPVICHETGIIYPSLKDAAKAFGTYKESIHRVLRGRRLTFRGFTFSYYGVERRKHSKETIKKIKEARKKQKKVFDIGAFSKTEAGKKRMRKPIMCHQNGIIYESAKQAAELLGIGRVHISSVLTGRRKHTFGFTFCYANNLKLVALRGHINE